MCQRFEGMSEEEVKFYKEYNEYVLSVDKQEPDIFKRNKAVHPPPDWWVKTCANNPTKKPEDV